MRSVFGGIRRLGSLRDEALYAEAKELRAPVELVKWVAENGRLPVVTFTAGGIATPADAALCMQLGADGVFVGSGIFKSGDPDKRAKAIVEATTHFNDAEVLARVSAGLGEAMVGISTASLDESQLLESAAGSHRTNTAVFVRWQASPVPAPPPDLGTSETRGRSSQRLGSSRGGGGSVRPGVDRRRQWACSACLDDVVVLIHLGGLTVLVSAVVALSYLAGQYGDFAYVCWALLVLVVLKAIALAARRRGLAHRRIFGFATAIVSARSWPDGSGRLAADPERHLALLGLPPRPAYVRAARLLRGRRLAADRTASAADADRGDDVGLLRARPDLVRHVVGDRCAPHRAPSTSPSASGSTPAIRSPTGSGSAHGGGPDRERAARLVASRATRSSALVAIFSLL